MCLPAHLTPNPNCNTKLLMIQSKFLTSETLTPILGEVELKLSTNCWSAFNWVKVPMEYLTQMENLTRVIVINHVVE